jgi:YD repeat-containing protein
MDPRRRPLIETAADGGVTQYVRDANTYITRQTDPLNRVTSFVRDPQGYRTQQTLPDGSTQSFGYQTAFRPGQD